MSPAGQITDGSPKSRNVRAARNVIFCLIMFNLALALLTVPRFFDFPITRALNNIANRSNIFDLAVLDLDTNVIFSGLVFVALIWACWFIDKDESRRARILVGVFAAVIAGVASRSLQYELPTHPRPFYDKRIVFHHPHFLEATPFNTWNSFPSDHVTVFAGLVFVIFITGLRFSWLAASWAVIVELSRTYMGAHYPSDLLGGAAIAGAVVWGSQTSIIVGIGERIMVWERARPWLFYPGAFLLSYQIATLFGDIRILVGDFLSLHHAL